MTQIYATSSPLLNVMLYHSRIKSHGKNDVFNLTVSDDVNSSSRDFSKEHAKCFKCVSDVFVLFLCNKNLELLDDVGFFSS